MRRLARNVGTLALGLMLAATMSAVVSAQTTTASGGSRTVWKHRVLDQEPAQTSHQQPSWSPYRPGQFGAQIHTVSESQSLPMMATESPLEAGPPVYDNGCDHCDSGLSCDSCSSCGPEGCSEGSACGPIACGDGLDCGGGCGWHECSALGAAFVHVVTNLNYFAGVHGFKGPTDLGRNGNFGFNYGMVWGSPLCDSWGLGYQTGVSVVHSNFTGDQVVDIFSADHRDQVFFTSGIFRRAMCGGIQWGVVYDLMRDNYRDNATTGQIRTEIAFSRPGCHDYGFFGAFGANNDRMVVPLVDQVITEVDLAPLDIYSIFYRRYFTGGGIGRVWGGLTNEGDRVFGADATVPLGTSWALENSFTYLAPKDGGTTGQERESWGVFLRLVWYPGRKATCEINDPYSPLMAVANNTNMLIDANPH